MTAKAHRRLPEYLRIAYGCMACDGEIDPSEVSCLRSIAIQMGQPAQEVDADLNTIRAEFVNDAPGVLSRAKSKLMAEGLSHRDGTLLVDLLVQLVEADGTVRPNEGRYIRDLVRDVGIDRVALREEHPEWRTYLAEGIHAVTGGAWAFAEAFASLPDINTKVPSE